MKVITAPEPLEISHKSIFLAGSIEQDKAEKWQDKVIDYFKNEDLCLLNPRRASWDASWVQEITNPVFKEQVSWELSALEKADLILLYLDPNTKAPISLLELGLFARSGKLAVCCPKGFWRKGNVDIVCERYEVPCFENFEALLKHIEGLI